MSFLAQFDPIITLLNSNNIHFLDMDWSNAFLFILIIVDVKFQINVQCFDKNDKKN